MHKFIDKFAELVEQKEIKTSSVEPMDPTEELLPEESIKHRLPQVQVDPSGKIATGKKAVPSKAAGTEEHKQRRPIKLAYHHKAVQEDSYNILETIHANQNKQRLQKQTNYIIDNAEDPDAEVVDYTKEIGDYAKSREKYSQSVIVPAAAEAFPSQKDAGKGPVSAEPLIEVEEDCT